MKLRGLTYTLPAIATTGCAMSLGPVPTASQLTIAVDNHFAWEELATVNCEGRAKCYNAAFGQTKTRNISCKSLESEKAVCDFEFIRKYDEDWKKGRSTFAIGTGPDGKTGWQFVKPAVN